MLLNCTQREGRDKRGYSAKIFEWQSLGQFVTDMDMPEFHASKYAADESRNQGGYSRSWFGDESYKTSLKLARVGREDWAKIAQGVYDVLETGGIELEIHQWGPDRAGAYPVVPDYLAGIPENMRRRLVHNSDVSPINVTVDITASAAFNASQLVKRGAACLALCMALQQHRPVTLYLSCSLDKGENRYGSRSDKDNAQFTIIKLDTIPMDLSQLAYLFGSPGFYRGVCMTAADKLGCGYSGVWPWGDPMMSNTEKYIQRCKDVLGLEPQDLYIPPICAADDSVQNPLAWIESHLQAYTQHLED